MVQRGLFRVTANFSEEMKARLEEAARKAPNGKYEIRNLRQQRILVKIDQHKQSVEDKARELIANMEDDELIHEAENAILTGLYVKEKLLGASRDFPVEIAGIIGAFEQGFELTRSQRWSVAMFTAHCYQFAVENRLVRQ